MKRERVQVSDQRRKEDFNENICFSESSIGGWQIVGVLLCMGKFLQNGDGLDWLCSPVECAQAGRSRLRCFGRQVDQTSQAGEAASQIAPHRRFKPGGAHHWSSQTPSSKLGRRCVSLQLSFSLCSSWQSVFLATASDNHDFFLSTVTSRVVHCSGDSVFVFPCLAFLSIHSLVQTGSAAGDRLFPLTRSQIHNSKKQTWSRSFLCHTT